MPTEIPVDDVAPRRSTFSARPPGEGGWRICIVDSAEDLNPSSANALLKIIEEPPPRSLFLIVAHTPRPPAADHPLALPQAAACAPSGDADLGAVDRARSDRRWPTRRTPRSTPRPPRSADGSVRRAVTLLDEDKLAIVDDTSAPLLDAPARRRLKRVLRARREGLAGGANEAIFETRPRHRLRLARRAASRPGPAPARARLAPLAEVWDKVARAGAREPSIYNLDRRPLVI